MSHIPQFAGNNFSPEVICVTLELNLTGHPFLEIDVFCSPWTNHPYLPNRLAKCFQIDTTDAHLHFIKVKVLLNRPIPTFEASKWPSNIGENKILASTDKISNYGLSTFLNRWGSTPCDCLWSCACLTQIWKHLAKWFGRYGCFSQGEQIYVCRGGHHSRPDRSASSTFRIMCCYSTVIICIIISVPKDIRSEIPTVLQMRAASLRLSRKLADLGEIERILRFTGISPPTPSNPNQPLFLKT
jgi:hypothetical protein